MLTSVGMVDDCRLVPFVSPSMGFVLLKPGGKGTAGFPNIHFTTLAWNAVDSREVLGESLVLVGKEDRLKFGRGAVTNLHVSFFQNPLDLVRGRPQVWEDNSRLRLVFR